jgi:hypothetical protein
MRVGAILSTISISVSVMVSAEGFAAEQVFAYPNAGQTEAEQSQDRFECHQWAVTQSGFDPSSAAPLAARPAAPPPTDPRSGYSDQRRRQGNRGFLGIGDGGMFEGGGMMGDAATGAALGAAGGALAGDVGEGAAIGALASTLFGAINRSSQSPEPPPRQSSGNDEYYRQQQTQADADFMRRRDEIGEYNRAFGACMTSRNYTVN